MPDEPHSKIDELLKTYAQKRREEAGGSLEMHPATRKLLQDEVARLRPKQASKSDSSVSAWILFWPRLAWGVAILVVVGVAAWMLMPQLGRSPASSASKTQPSLSSDEEAKMALAKNGSDRDEELRSPALRLADRTEADESSQNTVRLQLAPPNLPAEARSLAPQKSENSPASLAPIDALGLATRTTPSLTADGQKEKAGRDAGKLGDRGVGVLSAGALAEPQATALNGQRQLFASQTGALAGEGLTGYSLELAPPVSELLPTNGVFLAGSPSPQPFGPVPPSPVQNRPEEKRYFFRDEAVGKENQLTRVPNQKTVLGETLAAPQPAPSAARELASATHADKSDLARLRFNQVIAGTEQTRQTGHPPAPAILNTFELEQKGDRIRILDADGSVYEGQLALAGQSLKKDLAGVSSTAELRGRKVESPKTQGADTKAQSVSFRASGTNRSLNQLVVIDCTLSPAVEAGFYSGIQTGAVLGVTSAKPAVPQTIPPQVATVRQSVNLRRGVQQESNTQQQSFFLPTRVQGAARIGATNQIQINAIQVAP